MPNLEKYKDSFIYERMSKLEGDWPYPAETHAQINEFVPETCKLPYEYLFRDDPKAMAECLLLVWEYIGVDQAITYLDAYNFESEAIGAKLNFYTDHIPDIDRSDFLIKDESDFDKIRWHGPQSGRFPYLVSFYKHLAEYTGLESFPLLCAPWSLACNIYGLENLLMQSMTKPEFVHEMMRRIVDDLHAPMFREMSSIIPGFQVADLVDAWCSPPMVTNEIIAEFSIPYINRLTEKIGMDGIVACAGGLWGASLYTGEKRRECMDLSVAAASNVIAQFQDPDVEAIGPEAIRQYADEKNLQTRFGYSSFKIQSKTAAEIVEDVKHYTLAGMNGKTKFIFLVNAIGPQTPIENIHAAFAAAKTYGMPYATADTPFAMPVRESFEEFLKGKIAYSKEGYGFHWLEKSGYAYLKP